jgi:tagatose-6-phosphate ketose/aldose isomerase
LVNPLRSLLDLSNSEKVERGLEHTPREIAQQPETWRTTFQRCRDLQTELTDVLDRCGIGSGKHPLPTVYLVGAGTSDYVGRALAPLLRKRWGCDVWAIPSTTMLVDCDQFHRPDRNYLWISFSRSGDSPEGVALLQRAIDRHKHIQHLVVTCNQHGKMAEFCSRNPDRAYALVLDDAVNDRGLAMTSSFTNMVVAGQCLASLDKLPEYGVVVAQMSEAGANFLAQAAEAADSVAALGCSRACFVGSGALRAVADESALKLVELTAGKVATMAESPLGLRHGPLSAVDGETMLVAFLSTESRRRGYEKDLLSEISRKRLARVRAVVTAAHEISDLSSLVDYTCALPCPPDFPDEYRPPLDAIFGQLLGLFSSLNSGLKPDQPSPTGAITRVVSPITLYA